LVTNADGVLEMKTAQSRHQVDSPSGQSVLRELLPVDFTEASNASGPIDVCGSDGQGICGVKDRPVRIVLVGFMTPRAVS
jgi:hypothetical protein